MTSEINEFIRIIEQEQAHNEAQIKKGRKRHKRITKAEFMLMFYVFNKLTKEDDEQTKLFYRQHKDIFEANFDSFLIYDVVSIHPMRLQRHLKFKNELYQRCKEYILELP